MTGRVITMPSVNFDGLSDTYETFMQDVLGAFQIPTSTLYGSIGPSFASDGGADMQEYYARIEEQMRHHLFEPFERMLERIKARTMRRKLCVSRKLKLGKNRRWRMKV